MTRKIILGVIIAGYFLFTSGLVFELTKSESINKLDIPYSAISGDRTGIVGTFYTENDIDCAKWLAANTDNTSNIYADINGQLLLSGYIEPYTQIVEVFSFKIFFEEPCYIFLTEWNVEHCKMVWHTGQAGLREYREIPCDILSKKQIVYQQGKAVIFK
jgi:uncharacterized membrane protein